MRKLFFEDSIKKLGGNQCHQSFYDNAVKHWQYLR